jgi:hypothetical protein
MDNPRRYSDLHDTLTELAADPQLGPASEEECNGIVLALKIIDSMTDEITTYREGRYSNDEIKEEYLTEAKEASRENA